MGTTGDHPPGVVELEEVHPMESGDENSAAATMHNGKPKSRPYIHWIILFVALLSVSSAAAVLKTIHVPPIMKAAWRLQATSILLLSGFIFDYRRASPEIRIRWRNGRVMGTMAASGFFLAIHFASWIWSIDHTSLAHSLLFVTVHPLIFVTGHALLYTCKVSKTLPSILEVVGSAIGFAGLAITVVDAANPNSTSTFIGNGAAFLGAVAIVVYLLAGRNLRQWMPLFMYAFPVTLFSALLLSVAALFEPDVPNDHILFGWLLQLSWLAAIGYIAVFPGFAGHTGINYIIKHINPLVVSVTLLMEPAIGSVIGYILGVSGFPGIWTAVGAPVVLLGLVAVSYGAYKREKKQQQEAPSTLYTIVEEEPEESLEMG